MPSLKILLIDDDPVLLNALEGILQQEGHTLILASGGQSGVDIFTSTLASGAGFDVVITDLSMPYVDGFMVATAIKQASPATPVILLTGWDHPEAAGQNALNSVDVLLAKPPRLPELRDALQRVGSGITDNTPT